MFWMLFTVFVEVHGNMPGILVLIEIVNNIWINNIMTIIDWIVVSGEHYWLNYDDLYHKQAYVAKVD